jgi:hypothetical protein
MLPAAMPNDEIHRGNVARLQPAWTYRTGELKRALAHSAFRAGFSTTPSARGQGRPITGRRGPNASP